MREANQGAPPPALGGTGRRLLLWSPVVACLAVASLFVLAFTGWGPELSPGAQLARDAPVLALSAATGVAAVAVCCGAVGAALRYALVGALPAVVMASAYVTDRY